MNCPREGTYYLAEALHFCDRLRDGWEWYINEDGSSVYVERHWACGKLHGIEREWNGKELAEGFPKFHVSDKEVPGEEYLLKMDTDPELPPYRKKDDRPARSFPEELLEFLVQKE